MLLPDVNVLVYAHRGDSIQNHEEYANWIYRLATGPEPFALSVLALSGFVRVVTNARIFAPPSALDEVFGFIAELALRPTARIVGPGPDHLAIFERLCRDAGSHGEAGRRCTTRGRSPSSTVARWCRPNRTSTGFRGSAGGTRCAHELRGARMP